MSRAALACIVTLLGCESTALSVADPAGFELTFEPSFLSPGEDEVEVEITFAGVRDPDEAAGTVRELLDVDLTRCEARVDAPCQGLEQISNEFLSNWRIRMVLGAFGDADSGRYEVAVRIRNEHGTFDGTGAFFVFR